MKRFAPKIWQTFRKRAVGKALQTHVCNKRMTNSNVRKHPKTVFYGIIRSYRRFSNENFPNDSSFKMNMENIIDFENLDKDNEESKDRDAVSGLELIISNDPLKLSFKPYETTKAQIMQKFDIPLRDLRCLQVGQLSQTPSVHNQNSAYIAEIMSSGFGKYRLKKNI